MLGMREEAFNKPTRWKFSSSFSSSLISKLSTLIFQLSILFLTSCSEIFFISINQLVPPEEKPKHKVRSIGVVNNFSQNNVMVANDDAIVLPYDADTIKELVAQTLANVGTLERVVVLDSLLYHPDSTRRHILSQMEVDALCYKLGVEAIYSIDYACLIFNPATPVTARSLNAYLCAHLYTPSTASTSGTRHPHKEMLEYWVESSKDMVTLAPQIPHLLAQNAIAPYLPSWQERERVFYYDRLCYALREARIYVYEDNWEAAAAQWRTLTESRYRSYRFMSLYNLALYHEMTDNIDQAIQSIDLAIEEAAKKNRRGKTSPFIDTTFVSKYREVLIYRKGELEEIESLER